MWEALNIKECRQKTTFDLLEGGQKILGIVDFPAVQNPSNSAHPSTFFGGKSVEVYLSPLKLPLSLGV